jgi:hypothetical protein
MIATTTRVKRIGRLFLCFKGKDLQINVNKIPGNKYYMYCRGKTIPTQDAYDHQPGAILTKLLVVNSLLTSVLPNS